MSLPNIKDMYWSGAPGIYGSARGGLVSAPTTDAAYLAWLAVYKQPQNWPKDATDTVTTAALDEVLVAAGLSPTGLTLPSKAQLQAYSSSKLAALFAIARPYSLDSDVSVKCDTTTSTGANLAALNAWGTADANATTQWVDNFGVVTQITGTQAVELAGAVIAYGQSAYAILASAMTGIAGSTITTAAQIDALAWPT